MVRIVRIISYWLPPIIWMALIFYFSSRFRVSATGKFLFDFIIFKTLHMIEYAILYFLLFRAFHSISGRRLSFNHKLLFPVFLSIFYALSDEFHQTLVPTREGKIRDVLIDSLGILLMYIYIMNNIKQIRKFL